ncbi:hypothetical protein EY643_03795 [Halioglobus maricola]|uniref:PilY1 beta-propeller domain-containing protein n=1 Tax=Halioglobus maricola TaxID=2601894 RepID=A0A5P9NGA0_9GAMM|nr:PilC/PilY family type IV pilus protein [Halioglobus maricola]QFU74837.1 hypothetical protein EY643_03795 [Halioglobus maricola]
MVRNIFLLSAMLLSATTHSDDIDIYLRALQRSVTAEVVLYVDWRSAGAAGLAQDLPAQLSEAIRTAAKPDHWPWGPPAVAITLLAPRVTPCFDPNCDDPDWALYPVPDANEEGALAALEAAMGSLAEATEMRSLQSYSRNDVSTVIDRLYGDRTSDASCAPPELLYLGFDETSETREPAALAAAIATHWNAAVVDSAGLGFVSLAGVGAGFSERLGKAYLPLFEPAPAMPWRGGLQQLSSTGEPVGTPLNAANSAALGAVMHSTPVFVDYGLRAGYTETEPDVRLLFGGNDGYLHMWHMTAPVDGSIMSGHEAWAVMPSAIEPEQRKISGLDAVARFPYGLDGSPVVHRYDSDRDGTVDPAAGDRVLVFFGLRRGGAELYGWDISEPDEPVELWQLSRSSPAFEQLGLTFSTPQVVQLDLGEPSLRTALLLGAGYSPNKDLRATADIVGNAIYLLDAESGRLLWRASGPGSSAPFDSSLAAEEMTHSFAAPPAVLDSDGDGASDKAYLADTGGQIWRVDLPQAGRGWTGDQTELMAAASARVIARLGGSADADRRFFHRVDVTRARDDFGDYDGVVLVSGNRANPLETVVANYAYLIKDRGFPGIVTHSQLSDVTEICRRPQDDGCTRETLEKGWALSLQGLGEKGLASPLVRSGKVYFSTYLPTAEHLGHCDAGLGEGRVYIVDLLHGAPAVRETYPARNWDDEDDKLLETQRYFAVGDGIPSAVVPYREGLMLPGPGPDGRLVLDPGGTMRWRVHWRESGVDPQ